MGNIVVTLKLTIRVRPPHQYTGKSYSPTALAKFSLEPLAGLKKRKAMYLHNLKHVKVPLRPMVDLSPYGSHDELNK